MKASEYMRLPPWREGFIAEGAYRTAPIVPSGITYPWVTTIYVVKHNQYDFVNKAGKDSKIWTAEIAEMHSVTVTGP